MELSPTRVGWHPDCSKNRSPWSTRSKLGLESPMMMRALNMDLDMDEELLGVQPEDADAEEESCSTSAGDGSPDAPGSGAETPLDAVDGAFLEEELYKLALEENAFGEMFEESLAERAQVQSLSAGKGKEVVCDLDRTLDKWSPCAGSSPGRSPQLNGVQVNTGLVWEDAICDSFGPDPNAKKPTSHPLACEAKRSRSSMDRGHHDLQAHLRKRRAIRNWSVPALVSVTRNIARKNMRECGNLAEPVHDRLHEQEGAQRPPSRRQALGSLAPERKQDLKSSLPKRPFSSATVGGEVPWMASTSSSFPRKETLRPRPLSDLGFSDAAQCQRPPTRPSTREGPAAAGFNLLSEPKPAPVPSDEQLGKSLHTLRRQSVQQGLDKAAKTDGFLSRIPSGAASKRDLPFRNAPGLWLRDSGAPDPVAASKWQQRAPKSLSSPIASAAAGHLRNLGKELAMSVVQENKSEVPSEASKQVRASKLTRLRALDSDVGETACYYHDFRSLRPPTSAASGEGLSAGKPSALGSTAPKSNYAAQAELAFTQARGSS